MLPLVTASVSRSLELCHGPEGMFKQPWKTSKGVTLWDCGMAGWGKHRNNTVYCVLVEELCSKRMFPPHSTLLYCTFSSGESFCFFGFDVYISLSLRVIRLAAKWAEEYWLIFQAHHAISVFLASILHLEIQAFQIILMLFLWFSRDCSPNIPGLTLK